MLQNVNMWNARWFESDPGILINVVCLIWVQLTSLVNSRHYLVRICSESTSLFALLLCLRSWARHGGHSSGFSRGILIMRSDWRKLLGWLVALNSEQGDALAKRVNYSLVCVIGPPVIIIIIIIIIIINPITARVVGAPQMILQPVFSIFPCSPPPSWTCRNSGLSIPWCCLPTSFSVCLVFFPLSPCFARWFWPDLMNGKHDYTTAVCISLRSSGGLRVVLLPAGSWHGLPRW